MTELDIMRLGREIRRKYKTRDPYALAEAAGVTVRFADFSALKGMYQQILGQPYIILKSDLPGHVEALVLMHELGHHFLHRELAAGQAYRNLADLHMDGRPEREANLFAADMLLSDRALMQELKLGRTAREAAAELGLPTEIVALKLELLVRRGHSLRAVSGDRRFLSGKENPS